MAIYHLHARIVSRNKGRSVVAAAAWQAGCRLRDERTGLMSDFEGARTIAFSEIILPEGAPDRICDRGVMWNKVEARETRRDAQLARQYDVALPDEFNLDQSVAALLSFARVIAREGFPVDVSLTARPDEAGRIRHHGYLLFPTRPLAGETFGAKAREWNRRGKLTAVRAAWADVLNNGLDALGVESRVDHRSNKDRGLPVDPGAHVGIVPRLIAEREATGVRR